MALLFAFSIQEQVEKYGAYVGLAAFLGLAVLSLLYFAQARELKRLRDWAGRAPERAAELQARVVAQAEEALNAPEVEPTVQRSDPQPAAAPGNGRPAGAPALIPMGPRPAVAMAAAAARAAAAPPTVTEEPPAEAGTAVVPAGDEPGDGAPPAAAVVPPGDESGDGAPPVAAVVPPTTGDDAPPGDDQAAPADA